MSLGDPHQPDRQIDCAKETRLVGEALRLLGKRNLVLAIHDPSFPGFPDEDPGRGTPYSPAGAEFLAFARELGFTGIQFGPQGQTSVVNLSPYDGTVFARNVLSIALVQLAEEEPWGGLVSRRTLEELVRDRPAGCDRRVANRYVHAAKRRALREAFDAFLVRRAAARPSPQVQALAARLGGLPRTARRLAGAGRPLRGRLRDVRRARPGCSGPCPARGPWTVTCGTRRRASRTACARRRAGLAVALRRSPWTSSPSASGWPTSSTRSCAPWPRDWDSSCTGTCRSASPSRTCGAIVAYSCGAT